MAATIPNYDARCPVVACETAVVTVIAIFFNAERFLEEAIESVFQQTFGEWELLLVDDGSTDRSSEIARGFVHRYPGKVQYLEHPGHENRGMSASRNLGLRHARGEFIAFVDADDVWLPEKLEEQLKILNAHPDAAVVYGATQYWYGWSGKAEDVLRDRVAQLGVASDTIVNPPDLARALLRNQVATTTGCLARREAIQRVGGYEESFRGMFEDQVFHSKVSLKLPIFVSSQCWYKYRRHEDSCCSVAERTGENKSERLRFLNWLETYSLEQRVFDPALRQTIKQERWKSVHPTLSGLRDRTKYRARMLNEGIKTAAKQVLPTSLYFWLRRRLKKDDPPPVGFINFGDLRRLSPVSRVFGFDRGTPVDRYYIENFLDRTAGSIHGRVLEVGDDTYTRKFGGHRVSRTDVLHVSENNPQATIVADLANAAHIPSDTFDCIILTQTLHLIYDVRSALITLRRILKPGGVLLATLPGISQIDHHDWHESWYWAFTSLSARRLFAEVFAARNVSVETYGNVLAATAFLQGISFEELSANELDHKDSDYPVTITVRATKESLD
ncbi:MAG TPA: glycosyltransferase [Blastocatellia bacterium]|nr:glycosyltransferase [Blastocatellia bacterium]